MVRSKRTAMKRICQYCETVNPTFSTYDVGVDGRTLAALANRGLITKVAAAEESEHGVICYRLGGSGIEGRV